MNLLPVTEFDKQLVAHLISLSPNDPKLVETNLASGDGKRLLEIAVKVLGLEGVNR